MKKKLLKLSDEEVRHIANLANLFLTEEEVKKFQKQLSETLKYVEVLNELKTDGIEPTSQVTGLENVTREDRVVPSLSQKKSLSSSSVVENTLFKTKGTIGK